MKGIVICLWVAATLQLAKSDELDYICPDEGSFLLPHPYKCELFIACEEGETTIRACDEPLQFNPISGLCDLPQFVNCEPMDLETEPPTTEPTAETTWTTNTPTEGSTTESTVETTDGSTEEPTQETTWTTDTPTEGSTTESTAETTDGSTEEPTQETTWTTDTPTEGSTTESTAETTLTTDSPTESHCPDEGYFILPYPYACEKFITCEDGVITIRACEGILLFNPEIGECDLPQFVDCEPIDPETELPTTETTLTTDQSTEGNTTEPTVETTWTTDGPTEGNTTEPTAETTWTTDTPLEFHCPDEGYLILPHPYACEKFITCEGGVTTIRACEGILLFNPEIGECDLPQFVDCDPIDPETELPTTETTLTTDQSTEGNTTEPTAETTWTTDGPTEGNTTEPTAETTWTTDTPLEFHCPDEGYLILPHPYACEKFITCEGGVTTIRACEGILLFNPEIGECDLPQFVDCDPIDPETELPTTETTLPTDQSTEGNTTEPTAETTWTTDGPTEGNTTEPTAETTWTTDTPLEFHCPDEGYLILPHPYACEKFITCEGGVTTIRACEGILLFNPEIGECDLPQFVDCDPIDPETELPTTETTLTTDQSTEGNTTEPTAETTWTTDGPTEGNTTEPTAETTWTTDTPLEFHCPDEGYLILPHPYACEKFITCEDGVTTIRACEGILLFNPEIGECDLPQYVDCEPIDPETELPTTETTLTTDQSTEGNTTEPTAETTWTTDGPTDGNTIEPTTETTWTTDGPTDGNTTEPTQETTLTTDGPTEGNTTEPTQETTWTTDTPTEYYCPDEGYFLLPHPYACEKFIICEYGVTTIGVCEGILLFNPEIGECDLPEFVDCEPIDPETELPTTETTITTDQPTEGNTTEPTAETTWTTDEPTEGNTTEPSWTTDTPTEGNTTEPTAETTWTTDGPTDGNTTEPTTETTWTTDGPTDGNTTEPTQETTWTTDGPTEGNTTEPTQETTWTTDGPTEGNTTEPTQETTWTTDTPTEYYCPDEGYFLLPHPYACEKFIICEYGVTTIGVCEGILLFNPEIGECDLPEFVDCESIDPETELPTTETTITTDQPTEGNTTEPTAETTWTTDEPTEGNATEPSWTTDTPTEGNTTEPTAETTWTTDGPTDGNTTEPTTETTRTTDGPTDGNTTEPTQETTWTTDGPTEGNTTEATAEPTEQPTEVPTVHPDDGCDSSICKTEHGEFAQMFAHSTDCTKFCKCNWGVAHGFDCSPGLHFNPEKRVCDWPLNAGCTATTATPIIENPDITQDPGAGEDITSDPENGIDDTVQCPSEGQVILPHPSSCSHFIECNDGKATVMECVEGLIWNPDMNSCDTPDNFTCDLGASPDEPETSEESDELEVTEQPEETETPDESDELEVTEQPEETNPVGQCPPLNGEYVDFLPDAYHCDRFYKCDWGTPILTYCPAGLHFNPSLNVCDWPAAAGCTAGPTNPEEEIDQEPEAEVDPEGGVDPGSEPEVESEEEVDPEAGTEVDQEVNVDDFECASEGRYRLPHPKSCSHFVDCDDGQATLGTCEFGLEWNDELRTCDTPDSANCHISGNPEEPETPEESEEVEVPEQPEESEEVEVPEQPEVSEEIEVPEQPEESEEVDVPEQPEESEEVEVPEQPEESEEVEVPEQPEESGEEEEEEEQTEEPEISEEEPEEPEEVGPQPGPVGSCVSENGQYVDFLPDGFYCDRFYKCDWGNPVLFYCASGLHFNPTINVCDWPASAGCTAPN